MTLALIRELYFKNIFINSYSKTKKISLVKS